MACPLSLEKVWTDKGKYDEAEKQHFEKLSKLLICNGNNIERDQTPGPVPKSPISNPLPLSKNHKSVKTQSMIQSSEPPPPTPIPAKTDDLLSKSKSKKKKKSKNSNSSVDTNLKIAAENVRNEAIGDLNIVQKIDEFISKCPRSVQSTPVTISQKDFKPKEVKEKRNKADKRKQESSSIDSCKSELCEAQGSSPLQSSLAGEVARARQHIKNSLECMDGIAALVPNTEVLNRLTALEKENASLQKVVDDLRNLVIGIQSQVKSIAVSEAVHASTSPICARPAAPVAKKVEEDEDDGVDLFGSDSEGEDEAAAKIRDERLAAYAAKKSKKPVLIAKSNIILDVKPWDDETDMKAMEAAVREVKTDGLLWGAAKLVPLAYGIHKLQISCVVEDDKVSIDWLQEELEKIEDYVQSVDIAAFNKV